MNCSDCWDQWCVQQSRVRAVLSDALIVAGLQGRGYITTRDVRIACRALSITR